MKHMILSFEMKGNVISDYFYGSKKILWIQSVLGRLELLGGGGVLKRKSWILVIFVFFSYF